MDATINQILSVLSRQEELSLELDDLTGKVSPENALQLLEAGALNSLNFDSGEALAYKIADEALQKAIRDLFPIYKSLIYVGVGFCTEEFNDENEPGLNTVVFGFRPKALSRFSLDSIRAILDDDFKSLSSRERLLLKNKDIRIPVVSLKNFFDDDKEEEAEDEPKGFEQVIAKIDRLATLWFYQFEKGNDGSTNQMTRFWRDGETTETYY